MKVDYIAQYVNTQRDTDNYRFSPGGVAKMDYYLFCMQQLGMDVTVHSFCLSKRKMKFFQKGKTTFGQPIRYACTIGWNIKGCTQLWVFFLQLQLFIRLLLTRRDRTVFVYHERFYAPVIKLVRAFRELNLILDIEEIYSIHAKLSPNKILSEINYLKGFNKYILANKHLANELGLSNKRFICCNGVYAPIIDLNKRGRLDEKRVLYAGTFNRSKGGAIAAIKAIELLKERWKLHICGFGCESERKEVTELIEEVNRNKGYQAIEYEGYVPSSSKRYSNLLKICNIGLSTQNNVGKYNSTSFPSKIFEYMRHGIKVVSTLIPGVDDLPVSKYITFVDSNSPEKIAKGIKQSAYSSMEGQTEALIEMHNTFIGNFKRLFS